MKTRVLDSWAILEWINGREPAASTVAALLTASEDGRAQLVMSAINAGEVYYVLRKNHSESLAESWRKSAPAMPMRIETPTTDDIWSAALLKGWYPISYADAFAAALAQKHDCPLTTGDPEFRSIQQLEIEWIGPSGKRN